MSAAEPLNLSGKDWLNVTEAAHYCGVSESQFRRNALAYGLAPRRFMGKQLYEKSALYAPIHGAHQWQQSNSAGAAIAHTSTGDKLANGTGSPSAASALMRLKKYEQRKKLS
ncbi:hypothetical protein [Xanthomonas vesicatoria]|uniref:hypothetical protein n=1 Tax=Xanthomonas vesicatoria TaxID=56460 RepID=UPI0009BCACC9|nr:hypothetical protein [Xanthomonas vesicatoria]MCC8559957.1 hypothetical protein [Xanthomonas vesicatoria]MCC8602246.1 hypothetical protein [Xanthomonas vesicatoria]MCC8611570.1 hypothetical protein [Xanthomonas vesicatoria]MCC8673981.1 hypothetical protein [Xanthomonas vesicatoria]MCC8676951.1 hypothetical protein [Xanthomonas vesicatoria]